MKVWSREALVLGGVYSAVNAPFAYFDVEPVTDILYLGFIICAVMLCFNKTPKFIALLSEKYPRLSYYLASFGWLPYLVILLPLVFFVCALQFEFSEKTVDVALLGFSYILTYGIPFSLIIAFVRQRWCEPHGQRGEGACF